MPSKTVAGTSAICCHRRGFDPRVQISRIAILNELKSYPAYLPDATLCACLLETVCYPPTPTPRDNADCSSSLRLVKLLPELPAWFEELSGKKTLGGPHL